MLKIFANSTDTNKDAQNDLGASDTQLGSTNIMMKNQNSTQEKQITQRHGGEEQNSNTIGTKGLSGFSGKGQKNFVLATPRQKSKFFSNFQQSSPTAYLSTINF